MFPKNIQDVLRLHELSRDAMLTSLFRGHYLLRCSFAGVELGGGGPFETRRGCCDLPPGNHTAHTHIQGHQVRALSQRAPTISSVSVVRPPCQPTITIFETEVVGACHVLLSILELMKLNVLEATPL